MIGTNFEEYVRKRWHQSIRQVTFDKNYLGFITIDGKKKKENKISMLIDVQFPITNAEYYQDKRIKGNLKQQFCLMLTKKQIITLKQDIENVLKRPAIKRMK